MSTRDRESFEFDVALSFAGEDRDYVEEVAAAFKASGVKLFLDSYFLAEMWGEDLVEYLDRVYREQARYAVIFVSRHYAEKMWPRHERRSIFARAVDQRSTYVLPVRLDDSDLPGLRPTVSYIDARRTGIDGLVRALTVKLSGAEAESYLPISRTPRNQAELARVLQERPAGWEYLYLIGVLLTEELRLEPKYRDHELGYTRPSGQSVDIGTAIGQLQTVLDDLSARIGMWPTFMSAEALDRAVGKPGEAGDPARIEHLARRWVSVYEDMLDWAAALRGTRYPEQFRAAFGVLAQFADRPLQQFRQFVDHVVRETDGLPEHLAAHEPFVLVATLTLTLDEEVSAAFSREMSRLTEEFTGEER